MSNANHVSSRTPQSFGLYTLAEQRGVSLATTGNAIVSLPVLGGGLTGSGNTVTSGAAIVRRITIANYSGGNLAAANISVGFTNDGANLVANAQTLTTLTANNQYLDLTLSATGNTTMLNGNISSTLYVNVVASAAASVDVQVLGQVIKA